LGQFCGPTNATYFERHERPFAFGTLVRLEPMPPERKKGGPKAALCRCKLITHLKGALEFEAQTRSGRVTNAVAPDIDTQVAQTIA
jgi:hypothetical protein